MITAVHLENWRAYRNISLRLEPGTTFYVAMNGVGKSSLIEAVQWAFNRDAKSDPNVIRKGHDQAVVDVELDVDEHHLRVRRSVELGNRRTTPKTLAARTEAWIDGDPVEADEAFKILATAWGADIDFVCRTAFLTDGLIGATEEPDLRTHLCQAFALDHLHDAVDQLEPALKAIGKDIEAARSDARHSEAQLKQAQEAVGAETAAVDHTKSRVQQARTAAVSTGELLAASQKRLEEEAKRSDWEVSDAALRETASEIVGVLPPEISLATVLRAASQTAERQVEQLREQQARLIERLEVQNAAIERLRAAQGDCPVCRRPLDDQSRGHAETLHEHDHEEAQSELSSLDVDTPTMIVNELRKLIQKADAVGEAPVPPENDGIDLAEATESNRLAKAELETALLEMGAAESRLSEAVADCESIAVEMESAARLTNLYRKQGLLEATRTAIEMTVKEVLETSLGPVSTEINRRWDAVFADRPGIRVDPDGRIQRTLDAGDLDFESFSSGEKMVARLLLRLATLVSTTKVPFCWIDEPLEHLDPDSRRLVGRTLAFMSKQQHLGQVLVTTYEEDLAITLSQSANDDVRLEYLATSQIRE